MQRTAIAALILGSIFLLLSANVATATANNRCGLVSFSNGSSYDLTNFNQTISGNFQQKGAFASIQFWTLNLCQPACTQGKLGGGYFTQGQDCNGARLAVMDKAPHTAADQGNVNAAVASYGPSVDPRSNLEWSANVTLVCGSSSTVTVVGNSYVAIVNGNQVMTLWTLTSSLFCARAPTPPPTPVSKKCGRVLFSNGSSYDLTNFRGTAAGVYQQIGDYTSQHAWTINLCTAACGGTAFLAEANNGNPASSCDGNVKLGYMNQAPTLERHTDNAPIARYGPTLDVKTGFLWFSTITLLCDPVAVVPIVLGNVYAATVSGKNVTTEWSLASRSFCVGNTNF